MYDTRHDKDLRVCFLVTHVTSVSGVTDYLPSLTVPDSCCENNDCSVRIYASGCIEAAYNEPITDELHIMMYVSIGIGAVELITLLVSSGLDGLMGNGA